MPPVRARHKRLAKKNAASSKTRPPARRTVKSIAWSRRRAFVFRRRKTEIRLPHKDAMERPVLLK
jgi:hypothetical protein